ncbi:MAG TPA: flagellar filament capping protein FliD [Steroidobacteraceae bacterium]|nr:flagellar filament capping protein FliD [Steroidobacteraceae bacterium]
MATTPATTSTGSSAILQSLGIGSGLDINGIVQQLVTADMLPANGQVARLTASVGTQISAMGQLKGALSAFQTALATLKTQSNFQVHSASSADDTIFTATAATNAAPGTYQIEVDHLAQGQQLISKPIAGDGTAAVGAGALTLTLGSTSFSVNIGSDKSSLANIRDAINSASDNPGISATLVHGTNSVQLVLTSNNTGSANTIAVAASGDIGLNQLVYNASNKANYTELQPAQNSVVKVAGVEHDSSTNAVSDAIDGVTLNLFAEKSSSQIALIVANDQATVTSNVQKFISAYNTLQGVITQLGGYDASTQTAGPLLGQALLTSMQNQLSRGLTDPVSGITGPFASLAGVGITTNADGTLALDQSKLTQALNVNFGAVGALFGSTDGVGARLSTFVDSQLSSTGGIALRNQTLTQQQKHISDEQATIAARTQQITLRYQAQFTAMDTLLAEMQKTSSFITQQFQAVQSQTLATSLA